MTENFVRGLDTDLENRLKELKGKDLSDPDTTRAVKNIETLSKLKLEIEKANQMAYENELKIENEAKNAADRLEFEKLKLEQEINDSKEKLDLERAKASQESDDAAEKAKIEKEKVEVDKERLNQDKKQSRWVTIINGVMTVGSIAGSIAVPVWIMTAERRGEFFSNRALAASEKPPKVGLLRWPFGKK